MDNGDGLGLEEEAARLRAHMVETQIRSRGVSDERVLAAMLKVPRHLFIPDADIYSAYADHPVPIGVSQTISQPYMVAIMTEHLALKGHEKVLEIGTGSGYQAAVLGELAAELYTIERISSLAEKAERLLSDLGYENIHVIVADGTKGLEEHAPYDGVIVTAGAPGLAQPWVQQLAEGGRLVAPVGDRWTQELVVARKVGGKIEQKSEGGCCFVPLIGEHGWPEQ
jgi:protein-L-isoaspartate(D-aspartate) O-methyltransferase